MGVAVGARKATTGGGVAGDGNATKATGGAGRWKMPQRVPQRVPAGSRAQGPGGGGADLPGAPRRSLRTRRGVAQAAADDADDEKPQECTTQ